MTRTIYIGDVHGCREELEALLRILGPGSDEGVYLVGDLVAKGPDSQGVVQLARERGLLAVKGNHDAHLLRFVAPDEDGRPLKPAHRKVAESLMPADWRFLEALPLYRRLPALAVVVVHGGLMPGVKLEAQEADTLMNLRSITPAGAPSRRVDEGVPWASVWRGPEHVVFGHDAVRGLQRHPFATGLDTGCVYGKELTALVLPENRLVSVKARRMWADPKAKD